MSNIQYIDYFGSRKPVPSGYKEVSIARGGPVWFKGERMPEFSPNWETIMLFKDGSISENTFKQMYVEELSKNSDKIQRLVDGINSGDKYVFKCHCGPGKFCHRFIWKEFLELIGIEVREL